jgi:hypothetical protein
MELAIEAARARATVGEISLALENIYGRYKPVNRVVSGAYRSAYAAGDEVKAILARIDQFAKQEGTLHSLTWCRNSMVVIFTFTRGMFMWYIYDEHGG